MFKVDKFEVRFKRLWQVDKRLVVPQRSSKYDVECRITEYCEYDGKCTHYGIANLHPKDQPDKITGKKVALAKALSQSFLKPERTMIWDAFWEWVQSWGDKENEPLATGQPGKVPLEDTGKEVTPME